MEFTSDQYERIVPLFPKLHGKAGLSNLQVSDAILRVAEHGCRWHDLHASEPVIGNGLLDRVFEQLQRKRMVHIWIEALLATIDRHAVPTL